MTNIAWENIEMKKIIGSLLLAVLLWSTAALAAVDLNSANQAELESVKGIGPARAKAILVYRKEHGAFKSVDDLAKVKGFGKSSVDKVKGQLTAGSGKAGRSIPQ